MLNNAYTVHVSLLPYEHDWTCIACGYNVRKQYMNQQRFDEI